jgi:NADH-quinone oxidoreductase subunit B
VDARTAVVVSGTVTDRLAPAVASVIDSVRDRQLLAPVVVAYGVCASSGGPYWDSYAVTKGVDALVDVDVYVPGCPPTPAALREVLDAVVRPVASARGVGA